MKTCLRSREKIGNERTIDIVKQLSIRVSNGRQPIEDGGRQRGGSGAEEFRNEYPCKYARIVSVANCSVFCRGSANNRFAFQR